MIIQVYSFYSLSLSGERETDKIIRNPNNNNMLYYVDFKSLFTILPNEL
jgi:hypothetical protein